MNFGRFFCSIMVAEGETPTLPEASAKVFRPQINTDWHRLRAKALNESQRNHRDRFTSVYQPKEWTKVPVPVILSNSVTNHNINHNTNHNTNPNGTQQLLDKHKEVLAFCIVPSSSREILNHIRVTYQYNNIVKFINRLIWQWIP